MKLNPRSNRHSGFALIVTLSLMILLTVIAVGLLSLSTITLRSTTQGAAQAIAKSNARLAMMMALGELQRAMGTDTAVSAPASSVVTNAGRPHVLGTWKRPGDPTDPLWADWRWIAATSGMPNYAGKSGLFNSWLVSTNTPADAESATLPTTDLKPGKEVITLVGDAEKPLPNNGVSNVVNAQKVKIGVTNQRGKIAWAVFDESTKAPIHLGEPLTPLNSGTEIATRTAPGRVHAEVIDSTKLSTLETPLNLISLNTAMIPAGKSNVDEFKRRVHDFTTDSVGLMTDTANGGLKTDLTSVFEGGVNPPGGTSPYPSAFTAAMGYPTWSYLRSHYSKYKFVATTGSTPTYTPTQADLSLGGAGALQAPGQAQAPTNERLIPVISKFQLIFSMVAHHASDRGRRTYLDANATNAQGQRDGYLNHGIPHLAYDPVVTLYNPYDVALKLTNIRLRVWNPPVGFRITKLPGGTLRDNAFHGLGTFTHLSDSNPASPKYFTLLLTDGTSESAGNDLKLLPGEVKVFSSRVEKSWNWGVETAPPRNRLSFFDWGGENENANDQSFSNKDRRPNARFGNLGVEAVPGWEPRAGLQSDHLSWQGGRRPTSTLYPYENPSQAGAGFVTIRKEDSVKFEVQPYINNPAQQPFQLDLLGGKNPDVNADLVRRYKFTITNPINEMSRDPAKPIISRQYKIKDILQADGDMTPEFKKPFAMLDVTARTTKDNADSKPWLYNNIVVEGGDQNSAAVGLVAQSYDIRLSEIADFDNFPDGVSMEPDSKRGFFGATAEGGLGSNFVTMFRVPVVPAASLGDFIPANLAASSKLPRAVHPFGNSRAHPLVDSNKVATAVTGVGTMLDHSYLLNDSLWDKYYFSSLAAYPKGVLPAARSRSEVLEGAFTGEDPALNSRLVAVATPGGPEKHAGYIDGIADPLERSRQITKSVGISGPFNVNSTSVDAWRAVLSSLRGRTIYGLDGSSVVGNTYAPTVAATAPAVDFSNNDTTPFVRVGKPLAGDNANNDIRWSGFRALTDAQITTLATSIVTEIKKRGAEDKAPPFSLGEFVNRRLGGPSDIHSLAGLLQTAIDNTDINNVAHNKDSEQLSFSSIHASRKKGVVTPEVLDDNSAEGAPSVITQGDLMMALAPIATVRGDTFKIRAYGESTTPDGNTILASAWCEAIVQRVPDFVDPADAADTLVTNVNPTNQLFGRRFNLVSFRWLSKDEI